MLFVSGERRFAPGHFLITPAAMEALPEYRVDVALSRHLNCDWGDLCEADKQANDDALKNEGRLLSAYRSMDGTRFWIITEADRSATTVLLPQDY